jgi:predicted lipoprotein with Yx(FWY)xxD motif
VALAACGGDDGDSGGSEAGTTGGDILSMATIDGSDVLVDGAGQVLYTADVERGGTIKCVDQCTAFWVPLEASPAQAKEAAATLGAELSVVERPEGSTQLELDGVPLYTFTSEGPGELMGDGFVDDFQGTHFVWEAAAVDGSAGAAGNGGPADSGGFGY